MRTLSSFHFSAILIFIITTFSIAANGRDFYEIKIYILKNKQQYDKVENFLKVAYLPALHKAGISKVGVFTPVETDTASFGKKIYVFIPYPSLNDFTALQAKLDADQQYQSAGADYLKSTFDAPPYQRIESILLKAFIDAPEYQVPSLTGNLSQRIYELRSYESATENLYANKVKMFNKGDEIGLFKRLGFNAVFYGDVLAGSHTPNLMYMTSFNSLSERDSHWKSFGDDPQWKKLFAMDEYQHNVSKADIILLHPAAYSDL